LQHNYTNLPFMANYSYFNRDLSWLSFNYRVLQQAFEKEIPLYERIKFLAIYSNNLEEFYRVRVSYYQELLRTLPSNNPKNIEVQPRQILQQINAVVSRHQAEFNQLFYNDIIPELKKNNIILVSRNEILSEKQEEFLQQRFEQQILTAIQPVLLVKNRIRPFLKTGHVYIALRMYVKGRTFMGKSKTSRPQYAIVKLPTDHNISRFIELPENNGRHYIMLLEDLIIRKLYAIFPGYLVDTAHSIKVTRDADLDFEDFETNALIETVEDISKARALGETNRFQYDIDMPAAMLRFFTEAFDIHPDKLVSGGRTHNFRDLFSFPNPYSPHLEDPRHKPLTYPALDEGSLFEKIEQRDFLLHFPYQSFNYFLDFLAEAGKDPEVTEICTTQYRVASNSAVVDALIDAALKGRKVNVFVELKARFDEESNLAYAKEMRKAGINIMYSIPGLKVHSKVALIKRPAKKNLAFLGTGNFNEKTARLYGDHGFFTSDARITSDLSELFCYFNSRKINHPFAHILVPNFNMADTYLALIAAEIAHAKQGNKGYMIIKLNGLEDPVMIDKLYEASEAGVQVDLLVRGVCRLVPEQEYSKNIRCIRIVDRFLEHARVFFFHNNGQSKLYMGSADWMKRNLYRRVECVFPIYDETLKQEVLDILNIQLSDNVSARLINKKMENVPIVNDGPAVRSQTKIYSYLREKYNQEDE